MNNKKILIGIIAVLAALLILETGYMVGKARAGRSSGLKAAPYAAAPVDMPPAPLPRPVSSPVMHGRVAAGPANVFYDAENEWDPFREMQRMQEAMNRMFNNSFSRASIFGGVDILGSQMNFDPDIDVEETDKAYIVKVDLPGVDKDKIDIDAQPNSVTISGEREIESSEDNSAQGFYRSERSFGSFSRMIPLMKRVKTNEVTAATEGGVLVITLPKEEASPADAGKKVVVQ